MGLGPHAVSIVAIDPSQLLGLQASGRGECDDGMVGQKDRKTRAKGATCFGKGTDLTIT